MVDSEEEDDESCPSHDSFHELKDSVRECLEKEPSERNADDLGVLLVGVFSCLQWRRLSFAMMIQRNLTLHQTSCV